jgi:hypothetical protein
MEYNVVYIIQSGDKLTKLVYNFNNIVEAKKAFHARLTAAYGDENLKGVICMLINSRCGVEAKEYYYAPDPEPTSESEE